MYRYSWFITRYNDKQVQAGNTSQAVPRAGAGAGADWYLDKVNALFVEESDELSAVGILYDQL